MRIAIHSYVYHPESFLVNELAAELVNRGHKVQAYTGLPNYPKGEFYKPYSLLSGPYRELHNGVDILRYPIVPRKKGFFFLALNYLSHIVSGVLCSFRLEKAEAHIVFATSPITTAIAAIFRARLTGSKVYIWLQDLWPDSVAAVGAVGNQKLAYRLIGYLVHWIYKHTDVIWVQSPGFKANLQQFGFTGEVVDLPNWAPLEQNSAESQEPQWLKDFPSDDLTITFAGNIGRAQGIATILNAAALLKDEGGIKFIFVGDGSEKEKAEQFVRGNNLKNVLFYGRRPVADMASLFQRSTALLVSLSDDPIFSLTIPSKVQAYMAAGRPIIGSLNGVGADLIEIAKCGFVAKAMSAEDLSQAVLKLKQCSDEQIGEFALNAKTYYSRHFSKAIAIQTMEESLSFHELTNV